MKLFVLFNSTISMSLIGSHAEKLISKLAYQNTHTPNQAISGWMNFHQFVTLAPAGKNKFAMSNLYKELQSLSNGQYVIDSSNDANSEEFAAIGILLPSIMYNIGSKLLVDSDHNYIMKHTEDTTTIERMIGTRTVEVVSYPKNDVKIVKLLQKYLLSKHL